MRRINQLAPGGYAFLVIMMCGFYVVDVTWWAVLANRQNFFTVFLDYIDAFTKMGSL
jgi:hypothetical protein